MPNELITVTQLPVIEDRLREVKDKITTRVNGALSMVVSDDTVKYVKQIRADLRKEYAELETRRKEVKNSILEPYTKFEEVYKDCVGDIYTDADRQLKEKIDAVEVGLKAQKTENLKAYFNELRSALGIPEDLVSFENAPVKVTLSASEKSLREQVCSILTLISEDMKVIASDAYADEIMAEFRKTLNGRQATMIVRNRHEAMEAEKKRREEARAEAERRQEAQQKIEEIVREETPPAAVAAPSETTPVKQDEVKKLSLNAHSLNSFSSLLRYLVNENFDVGDVGWITFDVTGSIEKLRTLKEFLINGGFNYESK